jgi:lipid A 3-O-deacylase
VNTGIFAARYSSPMNSSLLVPQRPRLAAGLALALSALSLVAAAPAQAETSSGTALKNTAIAGTVATWAVALLKGAPVGSCLVHGDSADPNWGARVAAGKDAELKYASIGVERHECALTGLGGFTLDMSPVVAAGAWKADSDSLYSHHAWDVSFVPMMHWRYPVASQTRLDFEFGIGPAYLSESNIGDRQKGSNFQFSDHFGVGLGSADGHWRVGFAFRHLSNLSIRSPNNAVDFKGIALEWTP